jgi:hypothetical protein
MNKYVTHLKMTQKMDKKIERKSLYFYGKVKIIKVANLIMYMLDLMILFMDGSIFAPPSNGSSSKYSN